MSEVSVAKKIASKLTTKAEAGSASALETLERLLPSGASDAERAALRADPEKYKQYLDALDDAYGGRGQRSKDLGFSDKVMYHGSPNDIDKFNVGAAANKNNEIPFGAHFTEDAETASQFADDKKTGKNIGSVYPVRLRKEKTLDATPVRIFEGSPGYDEFVSVADKRKGPDVLYSNSEYNGGIGNFILPDSILNKLPPESATKKLTKKGYDSIDYGATYRPGPLGSGLPIKDPSTVVLKPENIRSTNAAFDPRFKDSADILALTGNQAPKIVSKILKPQMNLGDAFSAISEPIAQLDKPVTDAVDYATNKIAQQTNLVPKAAQSPVTEYAEDARKGILNQALQFATPTPSSLLIGKAMPLLKAAKGSQIAEKMITGDALAAGKAAMAARAADDKLSQFATKNAENRLSELAAKNAENKLSEFASKDLDWTNLEHMPSAAELYRNAKAANKGVVVVPSAADKVADKMNWGTVTVKP